MEIGTPVVIEDLAAIDGIIALLARQHPDLGPDDLAAFRTAICEHYGGEVHWIPKADRSDLVRRVVMLLGRYSNREIARRCGTTRSTVNRIRMRLLNEKTPG